MTLKSHAEFKENLTCNFKHDMRNLVNFHKSTEKSENFTSMGSFVQSIKVESEELSFITLNSDGKLE